MVATAICLALMLFGLRNILGTRTPDGIKGVGCLFGGLVIGLPAAVSLYYYRTRRFDIKEQQQIAVETLTKLAEQQKKIRK